MRPVAPAKCAGILTWNEAVNLVMGLRPRLPTYEVGLRMKARDDVFKLWTKFKMTLKGDPQTLEQQGEWEGSDCDPEAILRRITSIKLGPNKSLDTLCQHAVDTFREWFIYDNQYALAQSVLLAAALDANYEPPIEIFASEFQNRGSKTRSLSRGELAAGLTIDIDRHHLMPNLYGDAYPSLSGHSDRQNLAIFYNVRVNAAALRAHLKKLTAIYKSPLGSSSVPLKITSELKKWYCEFIVPFHQVGTLPTETQVTAALLVDAPDRTGHRTVARELAKRHSRRPLGKPRKSAK